jgi:dihydrofolate reductase
MAKLVYFVAVSADGFIASPDGAFDFFPVEGEHITAQAEALPETLPRHVRGALGASDHAARFGCVVMGRSTYEPALKAGLEHPYTPLPTVVFSRSLPARTEGSLRITGEDPMQVVRALKGSATRDIWLCGGAKLASQLVPLVDELLLKVNPVLVQRGIPLWDGPFAPRALRLRSTRTFATGVAWLHYDCA